MKKAKNGGRSEKKIREREFQEEETAKPKAGISFVYSRNRSKPSLPERR